MKTININIPEGYEIDIEASDLSKGEIALKPVQKKWEDIGKTECWFFDGSGTPVQYCDYHHLYRDTYPTKELLLAFEALRKLSFWRNEVWKEDNNWQPNYEDKEFKYNIISYDNAIVKDFSSSTNRILSFRTEELRDQFLKDHEDLINQAKPLL